ncbi:PI-actitoxin-Axm2b [Lamellibrachia satsuma]|nr:PI-actitoxin-Axm2b [Lamellibrachia satsuma]
MVASTASCGVERDDASLAETPRLPALCKLPAVPGVCLAYFPRWFFNSKTGKCERFIYGGCGGNKNNFNRKEECDKTCWCPPPCRCYCEFGFQIDEESSARLVKYVKYIFGEKGPCPPVKQCVVPDPTCCDGRPYNHVKQICCQKRLYNREDDVDCCAVDSIYRVNPPYNGIKEICCQGGNLYNRHPDVICPGCCGAKPYSTMDELCCDGAVVWKPRNGACCGKKAYNELEEICCDGVIQKRPPNAECCCKKAFDSRKFVCCGGIVQERPNNAFG